ncbi:MAG: hypothetical protein AB2L24_12110 [Mangrovibacterium sp.]
MKTLLTVFFMSALFLKGYAQDLIVTYSNDSINCRITSEEPDFIYFSYMDEGEFRKALIAKREVKEYAYNYFGEVKISQKGHKRTINHQRFRLSMNGGPGYRIGKISGSIPRKYHDYMKELKKGIHFSGDAAFFINETTGLGVKYSRFMSDNEMGESGSGYGYGYGYGYEPPYLSDDITISFIGPMLSTRSYSVNKKNAFYSNFSLGYLGYHDQGENNRTVMEIKGSTLGLAGDIGYQFGLSNRLSLGIAFSYTLGALPKAEVSSSGGSGGTIELDDDGKESLVRVGLSLGLIFHR